MAEHILIVDDDVDTLQLLSRLLSQYDVYTAASGLEALARVDEVHPDLIILDVMMPGMDGYEVCSRLRRKPSFSQVPIIMLTARDSPESRVQGFEAGADQYVGKPFHPLELQARVQSLLKRSTVSHHEVARPTSKIIAVFSLRGGTGVSSLAVNLAVGLAKIWARPTILADMVLTAGHDALMLGLPQNRTWADLAEIAVDEIDINTMGNVLLPHPSGLHLLAAPPHPEQSALVTLDKVNHVLRLLGKHCNYLVLDLPHDFHETTLAALDMAHEILVVMAPELASLLSMDATLEAFRAIDYPPDKVRVVLNRIFDQSIISSEDIEKAIKRPVDLEIPFNPGLFIPAIGKGLPPVLGAPGAPVTALLEDYAFSLSKEEHRRQYPDKPTKTWQRVVQRMQKRQSTLSGTGLLNSPTWLGKILREISETA